MCHFKTNKMTKKKESNKYQASFSNRGSRRSIANKIKKARKINQVKQAGNSDLLDSGVDVSDLIKSIIQEFSVIRKSDGLITGTNAVLRLLEKDKLIAIFMFKDKASFLIKDSIYKLCRQVGMCLIWLEDKDKHILGPEFPKSITYGIKNEPLATLENLRKLLLKFSIKRKLKDNKQDAVSFIDASSTEMKLPSSEETANQEVMNASTFYHTHECHISKKSNPKETGFLSLNKFSGDEKETNFIDYDSFTCSGILCIK